ncbi:MAG: radical SAM protein [Lentisphaeria bacterium]|nr:radical SAM protein [Lentisphaeria bacterium]
MSDSYSQYRYSGSLLRLPRSGSIDLTYRCDNNCLHCWQRLPIGAPIQTKELSFEAIRGIVDQARQAGCSHWSISGGEPMLRPDFAEIFDYLTRRAAGYNLNTNGTLLTPALAKLLTRKGVKMVAVYGADARTHDQITRSPGSFEACMRGMAYLREAGAGFTVQLVPMRDNFHQLDKMIELAKRLSPAYRLGASWLYLSATRDAGKNEEILRQRLSPADVVAMDPPRPGLGDYTGGEGDRVSAEGFGGGCCRTRTDGGGFLDECILRGHQFHIDPFGFMSLCYFMKDPSMRFDLNTYSFDEIWNKRLPACAAHHPGQDEYDARCGACDDRDACGWCPAYSFLERGRLSADIPYLCEMAKETRRHKKAWIKNHYQRFAIAGMTVHVDSDIPLKKTTFDKRFETFRTDQPGQDHLYISHHFSLPELDILSDAQLVYERLPWAVYRLGRSWIYLALGANPDHSKASCVAIFNNDHTHVRVHHPNEDLIRRGGLSALTAFPSDQIMLARVLADRDGCYLHSSGLILNGQGVLFVGASDAGKSTMVKMLKAYGTLLTDDRNIVRRWPDGHRVHGTWSHGEVPLVSNREVPLRAILFLEQAKEDQITLITNRRRIVHELLNRVIKPFCTIDWWEKTAGILAAVAAEVPCHQFRFTKNPDGVRRALEGLVGPLKREDGRL